MLPMTIPHVSPKHSSTTPPPRSPILHPLGRNITPGKDPRTSDNRSAVLTLLRVGFAGGLSTQINKPKEHSSAAVGRELADPFTTRLEITSALADLLRADLSLYILLSMKCGGPYSESPRGMSNERIGIVRHTRKDTIGREIDAGLDFIVMRIWA